MQCKYIYSQPHQESTSSLQSEHGTGTGSKTALNEFMQVLSTLWSEQCGHQSSPSLQVFSQDSTKALQLALNPALAPFNLSIPKWDSSGPLGACTHSPWIQGSISILDAQHPREHYHTESHSGHQQCIQLTAREHFGSSSKEKSLRTAEKTND